ncbi:MAG: hypothetical protein RIQ62_461 [Bacteroidota bacterium]
MAEEGGYRKADFQDEADVYVINTCSVTENADKECKQLVRRVKRQNPNATVVITGCYAQLKPNEIAALAGVDMVVGAGEKFNLVQHIRDFNSQNETKVYSCDIEQVQGFHSSFSLSDRTRTFLKVQDGCDYSCTFCTIPLARGHSRSDTIQGVVDNVQELALSGVKEVVLTGVNLGDFGKGFTGGRQREENFYDLVQALDALTVMPRYRISSIEPNLLSEEIIRFVAHSNHFMPHFHIPLQSGSNILLAAMKRRYRRELYQEKVTQIKHLMPHACIGVDVIVGFPGETDELFEETFQFLQSLDISYLHVFTYSERENTPAFTMQDVVPVSLRKQRNARLRALSEDKMNAFANAHRTQQREVLFEQTKYGERMEGYTDNYIRVSRPYDETLVNTLSMIEL